VIDRLINFLNRGMKAPGRKFIVFAESSFERFKLSFEVRDIDVLRFDDR
jgi:hypothetical protein